MDKETQNMWCIYFDTQYQIFLSCLLQWL